MKRKSICGSVNKIGQAQKTNSVGDGLCDSPAPRDGKVNADEFIQNSIGSKASEVQKDFPTSSSFILSTAAVAVCALLFYTVYGQTAYVLRLTVMTAILASASLSDIRTRHVTDSHTIMLLILSLGGADNFRDLFTFIVGILLVFSTLAIIRLILKQRSIGGADIKIVSAMAGVIGPVPAMISLALGLLSAIATRYISHKNNINTTNKSIPLLPYISASAIITTILIGIIEKS